MGLVIEQTYGRIGIETTPGSFDIKTVNARLDLQRIVTNVNPHFEPARIRIDQHDAFASAGLKTAADMSREAAQAGQANLLDFISKTAQDGKRYAAIENPGDAIAEIARRDTYKDHVFGIVLMPSVRPKITVEGGTLTFDPDPINALGMRNGMSGDYQRGYVECGYTPGQVRTYMRQYASISMKYQPDNSVDLQL